MAVDAVSQPTRQGAEDCDDGPLCGPADATMPLLLAEGSNALIGQWLQQVLLLTSRSVDHDVLPEYTSSNGASSCDDEDVLRGLRKALADLAAAGQLERILGSEAQVAAAPLVLTFLIDQAAKAEGGLRATITRDIALTLQITAWREVFQERNLVVQLPDECRIILASSGIDLERASGASELEGVGVPSSLSALSLDSDHQDRVKDIVQKALHEASNSLIEFGARIVVLGDAGVGKSSVVNASFGQPMAATGAGLAVTQCITLYEASDRCPVNIYDTKGFETLSDTDDVIEQLRELVEERKQAVLSYGPDDPTAIKEQIHAIWWVIDVLGGGRFKPESVADVGKILSETGAPIIMVLNKCDCEKSYIDEVERSVREHCLWATAIVRVVAHPEVGPMARLCETCHSDDIDINCKRRDYSCDSCGCRRVPFKASYGFEELIQVTIQHLPQMVVSSFAAAQKVWLEGLNQSALRTICGFTIAAAAIGASPIPFWTRFVLWPLQVAMVVSLSYIYSVVISRRTALNVVFSFGFVYTSGASSWCQG